MRKREFTRFNLDSPPFPQPVPFTAIEMRACASRRDGELFHVEIVACTTPHRIKPPRMQNTMRIRIYLYMMGLKEEQSCYQISHRRYRDKTRVQRTLMENEEYL